MAGSQLLEYYVVLGKTRHCVRSLQSYRYAVAVEDENGYWSLCSFVCNERDAERLQASVKSEYAHMGTPRYPTVHIIPLQSLTLDAAAERRYNLEAQARQEEAKDRAQAQ